MNYKPSCQAHEPDELGFGFCLGLGVLLVLAVVVLGFGSLFTREYEDHPFLGFAQALVFIVSFMAIVCLILKCLPMP